jgi:hypothetical protein
MSAPRPSFQPPKEEPAIPLEPEVAKARFVYVNETVEAIKQLKNAGTPENEISEKYSRFVLDYPAVFKMVMKTDNEGPLRTMLAMLERMGTGELSQHQASVIVGQRLHDIYIKPKIPEMERKD